MEIFKRSFLAALILTAAATQAVHAQAPAAIPEKAAKGKAKFEMYCVTCHGAGGTGDGPAAQALNPKPRNYTDAKFQASKTDADIAKVIKTGGAANGLAPTMPAWGAVLTDDDIQNIVAYVRYLGKGVSH